MGKIWTSDVFDLPKVFSEKDLFHETKDSIRLLGLSEVPEGSRVLDIGCGKGDLVAHLRSRGIEAMGIDILPVNPDKPFDKKTWEGLSQKPNIISISDKLPFADNSFDIVTNYWGGLSYPLHEHLYFENEPEIQKEIVLTFIKELKEAVRVSNGEVVIHPWSGDGFFETTGMIALGEPDWNRLYFLGIDFKKWFDQMGLEFELSEDVSKGEGIFSYGVSYQTIHLKGCDKADIDLFDEMLNLVEKADSKMLFFGREEIEEHNRRLAFDLDDFKDLMGFIDYNKRRKVKLMIALASGDFSDIEAEEDEIIRARDKMEIDLKGLKEEDLLKALIEVTDYNINKVAMPHIRKFRKKISNSFLTLKQEFHVI